MPREMKSIINLEKFPLGRVQSKSFRELVQWCQKELKREGLFSLNGFFLKSSLEETIRKISPIMASSSLYKSRRHNIYFKENFSEISHDHPVQQQFETANRTLCGDQLEDSIIAVIYEWPPLANFLAKVMGKNKLYVMADPLANVNVMSYRRGETLNWHFDRSEFTTTLLLQAPEEGGVFQYRTNLRSKNNPNYAGVAKLLKGKDADIKEIIMEPGTLNVFCGVNTPHKVTTIGGNRDRLVADFSFFERPKVTFTPEEQLVFYGRVLEKAH